MPRPPPTALDHPNYSFHDDHLLRKPPTVHHQLIDVHPRRGLLSRTRDIPVPIGAVRAPGRAAAGQLEIVQGLARALEDRHGHELREHVVDLQRDPRPVTIREQVPAQDERDRGRRVKRVRVVLLELHDGWRGLAPRAAHRRPSRPKPEPQHCPGVLHPPLLCERDRCLNRSPCYGSTVVLQGAGEKLCATAPGCQPRERPRVAGAAGDAAPIGPFEQGNQILAREPEAVTQHRRRASARRVTSAVIAVRAASTSPHVSSPAPASAMTAVTRAGWTPSRTASVERGIPWRPASAAMDCSRSAGVWSAVNRAWRPRPVPGWRGGRGGGNGSSTMPPPIVGTGGKERRTRRAPPRAPGGAPN